MLHTVSGAKYQLGLFAVVGATADDGCLVVKVQYSASAVSTCKFRLPMHELAAACSTDIDPLHNHTSRAPHHVCAPAQPRSDSNMMCWAQYPVMARAFRRPPQPSGSFYQSAAVTTALSLAFIASSTAGKDSP